MKSKISTISLFATVAFFGVCQMNAQQKNPGINLDFMDKSVKPGDDFF